ncbi:hypothetical protein NA56DRAFT_712437 [Hyaloscypha hepaticicola]|uniref:Xylulose 5-phosphate/Fructose 6-phosphate phosphoketolase N-terminal domain-containing protein n=1 Tax=Hyaloscypha hepaticicola TaxID=2082293 RepID=A0A2J6PGH0_9HELO|nr:hypothetical protein NA56DRAFT_712437 [Hyaloscypha hepaticicola]
MCFVFCVLRLALGRVILIAFRTKGGVARVALGLTPPVPSTFQLTLDISAQPSTFRPRWPMIVLRSPKGWTDPRKVDGKLLEGSWRAHQIPIQLSSRPVALLWQA